MIIILLLVIALSLLGVGAWPIALIVLVVIGFMACVD